jgi:hypothetical protein
MKKSDNLHDILVIDVHVEPPIEESPRVVQVLQVNHSPAK